MFIYRLISALIIGLYLLSPVVVDSWGEVDQSWYRPFAIWFLLIVLVAWMERRRKHDDF